MENVLDLFMPSVRDWFRAQYRTPTRPQALGWPAIQRGENVLVFSPTGSGKTMAAFLWGVQAILQSLAENPAESGVQLLYISPLKALNNDIERNLRAPLAGIRAVARAQGLELPTVRVAVRTGDTPSSARQRMVKQPPHILITTPESLYLLLTSPRARETLATVRTVIVDEIHTLCGNKRGVHLALSLERLAHLVGRPIQRIGLSATQRPLDEVGRFLGGQEWSRDDQGQERLLPRPVTIIDAGERKALDLRVVTTVPDLRRLPGGSIWPAVIPHVLQEIRRHRTTLVFVNGRRAAERAADRLNEQYAQEEDEEIAPGSAEGLIVDGVPKGKGMFGTGRVGGPFRAHHGSVSKEVRLELEHQLKRGELPALIATSSLELGIDIGSVDEVVQLQSPKSIARGLQRVGRSGHLVGQTSVGRIYATFREDLLDAGAIAHGMLRGDIEPTYTPQNCLDVLAQQIVAMVSITDWPCEALYHLLRQAYGYQNLTRAALDGVLRMLSGQYPGELYRELRPRLVWDRVHDRLAALPGSRLLALNNGGTIPDRGQFNVYLPDRKTLLGTLDEEFVFETQPGDVFTLGSGTWRALAIEDDRMVVADAAGSIPRMPFWRGEAPRREYHTGLRLGAFRRALAERVVDLPELPDDPQSPWPAEAIPVIAWLAAEYAMDENSARNAILYVRQQLDVVGAISSDHTVIVERFSDALGDQRLVIHSCFGGRVNSAWALALTHRLRELFRVEIETQVNDDGILFRFLQADRELPLASMRDLPPEEARERLLHELPNSALFGSQFRMNAARALLLPSVSGARRRTPFWLQRLRAKDLLAIAKGLEDFPLVAETYRDCLRDVLDLDGLMEVLGGIQSGEIRVVEAETLVPSPVASSLLFDFIAIQMYEGDLPKVERQMQALSIHRELLEQLLEDGALPDLLSPQAIAQVQDELQHVAEGYQARSQEELSAILAELGDLTAQEIVERCVDQGAPWLLQLAADGRAAPIDLLTQSGAQRRWVAVEHYARYRDAFDLPAKPPAGLPATLLEPRRDRDAARAILLRVYVRSHGPFTVTDLSTRYPLSAQQIENMLAQMVNEGQLVTGRLTPGAMQTEWCDRRVLERIHRRTLALLRQQVQPVELPTYADFLLRWQGLHPDGGYRGAEGLAQVLQQLRGLSAPAITWERDLLPLRVQDYRPAQLDTLCSGGDLAWMACGSDPQRARLLFFQRGEGALFLSPPPDDEERHSWDESMLRVWEILKQEGACYAADIQKALRFSAPELDGALVALVLRGVVTNDHFAALRRMLVGDIARLETERGVTSSLDEELDAWRASREPSLLYRPRPERLREARRLAARRVVAPTPWTGRWSLVHRIGVWGADVSEEERAEQIARQLLQRYGIVSRECLEREDGSGSWAALLARYQRMELRGEVRRGYFVQGLSGAQFALPEAVERLRALSAAPGAASEALVLLNACDPACVYGSGNLPDASEAETQTGAEATPSHDPSRFARLPSNYVVLRRGAPILLYQHGSARWTASTALDDAALRQAVTLLLNHLTRPGGLCSRPRRVQVAAWNGQSPLEGAPQEQLAVLGFRRETPLLVWDGYPPA